MKFTDFKYLTFPPLVFLIIENFLSESYGLVCPSMVILDPYKLGLMFTAN